MSFNELRFSYLEGSPEKGRDKLNGPIDQPCYSHKLGFICCGNFASFTGDCSDIILMIL